MKRLCLWWSCALAACQPTTVVSGRVEVAGAASPAGVVLRLVGDEGLGAVTDASGSFLLPSASPRPLLWASAEAVSPRSQLRQVGAPGEELLLRFTAVGTVKGQASRGGLSSGNAGIAVSVGHEAAAVTDDGGSFSLELPVGTHLVQASSPGYAPRAVAVTVERGQSVEAPRLVLQLAGLGSLGDVAGQVRRMHGHDHGGVRVTVEGAGRSTSTSSDGRFFFTDVPEGTYTLAFDYDGLTERLKDVMVVRGARAFIVDEEMYRLDGQPIPLMEATRVDEGEVRLGSVFPGRFASWVSSDEPALGNRQVRWLDAADGRMRHAGRMEATTSWSDLIFPSFTRDGSALVWVSGSQLQATSTLDGSTRLLATGFRNPLHWSYGAGGYGARVLVSSGGWVAYEGFLPGTNQGALLAVSLAGTAPRVLRTWPDAELHTYGALFAGDSLVYTSDGDNQENIGRLGFWSPTEGERALGSAHVAVARGTLRGRLLEYQEPWMGPVRLLDAAAGKFAYSHSGSQYYARFSADGGLYAWSSSARTTLFDVDAERESVALEKPLELWCVEGGRAVGKKTGGEVVAAAGGAETVLAAVSTVSRQFATCGGGRVYWVESGAETLLRSARVTGGATAQSRIPRRIEPYHVQARPDAQRVWFASDSFNADQLSWGRLWVAPEQGGEAKEVLDEVRLYPLLTPSPDGRWMALLARGGLYVVRQDGTKLRRLATGAGAVAWVNAQTLVFSMAAPKAPLGFQRGLYLARVP